MNDENMGLVAEPVESLKPPFHVAVPESRDPGNTDPAHLVEDLTDDEILEANAAVEATIQTLPVSNEGVL